MPNWMDCDEDDVIKCSHCGSPDDFHSCAAGIAEGKRENDAWQKAYEGKGKIKGKLTIYFECNDSDDAIRATMGDVNYEMFSGCESERRNYGEDAILEYKWKSDMKKVKV